MRTAGSCSPAGSRDAVGDSVSAQASFGVGLLGGLRAVESLELHAVLEHAHRGAISCEVTVVPLGVEDLRHEAAIGHGRCLAMAELPASRTRELAFQLGE